MLQASPHAARSGWLSRTFARLGGPRPPEAKASRTGPLIALESLHQPVWSPRDYASFAREGFMQNAIVFRAVRMVAEAAASVPLLLYDGDVEIEAHPLLDLIARPNPVATAPDLLEAWYGYLLVSGNAYLEAVATGGDIRELYALRPDRMQVVPGPDGWPEAYVYSAAGESVRFADAIVPGVRPILHVKLFHPANDHYGLSPLEAAATAIDIHNTASRWNKALLDNSARPSGALVYTARDGNLSPEQFERLKSELEAGFQGAAHAGRPLLLEGGLDWKSMSLSPKDMDFIEAKHVAAREIALALGVPPMLLGIPGDNTFSEDQYDPGGPTNLGITLAEFARWRGVHLDAGNFAALRADLRRLDHPEAARIYKANYWEAACCGFLPAALAVFHFDCAVNQGVAGAARMLQQALAVDIDARIGPLTIAAAQAAPVATTLARYAEARRAHYRSLSTFWRFGRGWLSRVDTTLALARAVAADPVFAAPKEPPMPDTTEMPASQPSTPPAPSAPVPTGKWWGKSMTVWGVIITSLSSVLPVLGPLVGINITAELVQQLGDAVVQFGQAGAALAGLVLTVWGRARASQPLTRTQVTLTV